MNDGGCQPMVILEIAPPENTKAPTVGAFSWAVFSLLMGHTFPAYNNMREVLQQPEPGRATEKHLEIVSPENAKPPPVTARVSYACGFDSHSLWNLPCRW